MDESEEDVPAVVWNNLQSEYFTQEWRIVNKIDQNNPYSKKE